MNMNFSLTNHSPKVARFRAVIGAINDLLVTIALSLFLLLVVTSISKAGSAPKLYPGPYFADVVSVYDGDTINVKIHTAPGQILETGLRVEGVDTPELSRSGCDTEALKANEKRLGEIAKKFVEERYKPDQRIQIYDLQFDKYGGRHVAVVARQTITGWQRLDDELIRAGQADPYGSRKAVDPLKKIKSWCEAG